MARRPSFSTIMLGGLPTDPPVDAISCRYFQLLPSSSEIHDSIQCLSPSLQRSAVSIRVFESRTLDGMIEKPFGSGPIQETKFQVFPPSVVRTLKTRPSRPFS